MGGGSAGPIPRLELMPRGHSTIIRFREEAPMDTANPDPNSPEPAKPRKRGTNVPIPIVVGIICLGLGIAGGILLAEVVGEKKSTAKNAGDGGGADDGGQKLAAPGGGKGGGKGGFGGKGGPQKGGGGPGGGKGGGGGGFGGFAKIQLAQLVTVLDHLTAKPPMFQLSADEKKQLTEQLAGLEAKEALTNEEAQAKLNAIIKLLEPHKEALQDAGFLWPGPPPGGTDPNSNPLKDSGRLKSLQSTLGKGG
jgi:hypothetical protein